MKQRHSATSRQPSKLCRLLLIAFTVKLAVLGLMVFDVSLPAVSELAAKLQGKSAGSARIVVVGAAQAAEGVGASPAIAPTVPGAPGGQSVPPANLGATDAADGTEMAGRMPRTLPSIGKRNAAAAAAPGTQAETVQNGTAQTGNGQSTADRAAAPQSDLSREVLARRQEELARKEQELRVLNDEITAKLDRMQGLENRLGMMMKSAEEAKDAKFRHLVDVLSNMKAKQAAAVLETLDQKIGVQVLANMRGRQAGEILTYVRPEIAAHLTEALARMQLPFE